MGQPKEVIQNINEKHKRFIAEYLKDLNSSRAYQSVYDQDKKMSRNTLDSNASRLLRNDKVQQLIKVQNQIIKDKCGVTREYVITNLIKVYEKCMERTPIDSSGANKSLELLGKHLKLFTDKIDVNDISNPKTIILKYALEKAATKETSDEAEPKINE